MRVVTRPCPLVHRCAGSTGPVEIHRRSGARGIFRSGAIRCPWCPPDTGPGRRPWRRAQFITGSAGFIGVSPGAGAAGPGLGASPASTDDRFRLRHPAEATPPTRCCFAECRLHPPPKAALEDPRCACPRGSRPARPDRASFPPRRPGRGKTLPALENPARLISTAKRGPAPST